MISQSLVSAWLLTFTISLDDVVLSNFLSGPGSTTMPLVIFSRARLGLSPGRLSLRIYPVLFLGTLGAGILGDLLLASINDRDVIVGHGTHFGERAGFLLRPTSSG